MEDGTNDQYQWWYNGVKITDTDQHVILYWLDKNIGTYQWKDMYGDVHRPTKGYFSKNEYLDKDDYELTLKGIPDNVIDTIKKYSNNSSPAWKTPIQIGWYTYGQINRDPHPVHGGPAIISWLSGKIDYITNNVEHNPYGPSTIYFLQNPVQKIWKYNGVLINSKDQKIEIEYSNIDKNYYMCRDINGNIHRPKTGWFSSLNSFKDETNCEPAARNIIGDYYYTHGVCYKIKYNNGQVHEMKKCEEINNTSSQEQKDIILSDQNQTDISSQGQNDIQEKCDETKK